MYTQNNENMVIQMNEYYNADEPKGEFVLLQSTDPIIRLFNCYQIWFDWVKKHGYDKMKFWEYEDAYNEFRLRYDGDARYYYSVLNDPVAALHGDTVTSFYTPYKTMLKLVTGEVLHKCNNPFDELIAKRNDPGFKEVNDAFIEFVENCCSKGNFMLLPHRDMNADRYRCSQDRIDKSLYECFPGGKLAKYFGTSPEEQMENLVEWIKSQNLEFMFENGKIERESIIPFNKSNPYVTYENMTKDELQEFIDNAVAFIAYRTG